MIWTNYSFLWNIFRLLSDKHQGGKFDILALCSDGKDKRKHIKYAYTTGGISTLSPSISISIGINIEVLKMALSISAYLKKHDIFCFLYKTRID